MIGGLSSPFGTERLVKTIILVIFVSYIIIVTSSQSYVFLLQQRFLQVFQVINELILLVLIEGGNLPQLAIKERYKHSVGTYDILLCQQSTSFIGFRIIGEKLLMALLLLFELIDALFESIVAKK